LLASNDLLLYEDDKTCCAEFPLELEGPLDFFLGAKLIILKFNDLILIRIVKILIDNINVKL